jgi:Tfp pilus assembly protein FimV
MSHDEVQFKLELARAWLQNGQEQLARNIIRSIIDVSDPETDN